MAVPVDLHHYPLLPAPTLCDRVAFNCCKVAWVALAALLALAANYFLLIGVGYLAAGAFAPYLISIGNLSSKAIATAYVIGGIALAIFAGGGMGVLMSARLQ